MTISPVTHLSDSGHHVWRAARRRMAEPADAAGDTTPSLATLSAAGDATPPAAASFAAPVALAAVPTTTATPVYLPLSPGTRMHDKWELDAAYGTAATGGPFLPLAGGTVTGPLNATGGLQATPTPIGPNNSQLLVYQGATSVSAPTYRNLWSAIGAVSGSAPGTSIEYNTLQISGDNSTAAGSNLLGLSYWFGGPNFTGNAAALSIGMNLNAASQPTPGAYYMGANIFTTASVSAGGTDTTTFGSRGEFYGLNVTPQLASGATNFAELTSAEIDSIVMTGATVSRRCNLKLILNTGHAVQGAVVDDMLQFGRSRSVPVGSLFGLVIGTLEGVFPIDNTNGVAIGHRYCSASVAGVNPQLKTFIDASHIRALTAHWLSPGASIDGSGNYTSGPARLAWSASGASLDVFGQTGGTPTVTAGGTGATTGQIVTTGNGDLYTVTASGGVITALAVVVAATLRTTGPTGAQTIQGDGVNGATCTIPWTNARTLALQPSGGAITSPLFINALNDAAAASAGVIIGQWYRNGSVMMQRAA